jgi:hypothetical protein
MVKALGLLLTGPAWEGTVAGSSWTKIPGTTCHKSVSARDYGKIKDMNLVCEGSQGVVTGLQRSHECSDRGKESKCGDEKIRESHHATHRFE